MINIQGAVGSASDSAVIVISQDGLRSVENLLSRRRSRSIGLVCRSALLQSRILLREADRTFSEAFLYTCPHYCSSQQCYAKLYEGSRNTDIVIKSIRPG